MPAPKSPVTVLAETLQAMPALQTLQGLRVLAGKNSLPLAGAPPRIVLFPVEAGYQAAADNVQALVDIDIKIVAHLWASSLDEAWDLRQRYIQALKQQAIGNPTQPIQASDSQAGVFYNLLTEAWDVDTDTAEHGQEMEVVIAARLSASPVLPFGTGLVNATAIHGIQVALAAPMTSTDLSLTVTSTAGFAASGSIAIDSEQMTYSGLTATTFTGLARGVNSTTPAAHAVAATVTQ